MHFSKIFLAAAGLSFTGILAQPQPINAEPSRRGDVAPCIVDAGDLLEQLNSIAGTLGALVEAEGGEASNILLGALDQVNQIIGTVGSIAEEVLP